ncbi:hypothetical protein L6164_002739 [Bauhinia variegata]|uniref:Uncharacterized protein n=1 Tax=Bauhinia variegata TaxID=167791 RepID=A0ACB9PZ41_BAUVA|nr:hypothetical protein L6164_002739 [Bauhinia variegata]
MEFLSVVFGNSLDFLLKPIGQELGYLFCYNSRVKELNQKAEKLLREKERVQHEVEDAERNGKGIHAPVSDWLLKVDEMIPKNEEFQKDGSNSKTKCFNGLFPNLIVRHQLGRRAAKLGVDVDELMKDSKFDEVSYRPSPTWIGSVFSVMGYESLKSRNETVEEIMKALRDSSVRIIGVCGQGGVGKTTIVKEVAKKAREMKLFTEVVMATATRNPEIKSIQGQIADMLGMTLEEESEMGRAGQLRERLKKYKENILVIIDDLWDGLDLNKLGVPAHDDDSSQKTTRDESVSLGSKREKEIYGGCKILLTSRSKEVLSTMAVKENSIISVEVLQEKEAELLFKKVARLHDKNSELDSLASKVAKKCAGLPVALVTVGRALKNMNYSVWNDVLRQLERQEFMGVQEYMEFSTKLSYDQLKDEELKAIFLLCAQMGNDSLIVDLLKYCIGLGILKDIYTIREARDKLNKLIGILKNSSLLTDGYSSDRFTIHDLVCDAALSIACKEQDAFIKRNIKLVDWIDEDKLEQCTTISLRYCDIIDELPQNINCPRLKVFHFDNKGRSLCLPDKFFEGMIKLRVLVLTGFDLSCMPSSIKCLKNLRMLCLEHCIIGDGLSLIGGLKKLRILSLSGSVLRSFPAELGHNLQLLDISNCFELGVIPPNVISCLNNLEEFYLRNILVQWEIEGKATASLAELSHLSHLKALDIHIPDLDVFPKNLYFHALDYYMIAIGDFKMFLMEGFKMPDPYEVSRTLALHLKEGNSIHFQKAIKLLFKTVENLFLGKLNGVEDIFYELNLQGFPDLKHLYIANNNDIKYIFNSMNLLLLQGVFPKLESLHLYELEKLETICSSDLPDTSFRNLKLVKIKMCHQLQNVFSLSMVRLLTKLETIEVSDCNALKEIVDKQRQGNTEIEVGDYEVDKVEFPELRHLTLQGLFQLTGFYTNGMLLFTERVEVPKLENLVLSSIKISQIWGDIHTSPAPNFQSLIKLDVKNCDNLKYLLSISMAEFLVNLKNLRVSTCEGMEELIAQEDSANITKVHIFRNLKEIELSDMRNLTEIWHKVGNDVGSDSYCNLESVVIEKCRKLVTVFPPYMAGMLKSIDSLMVDGSDSVETLFDIANIIDLPTDGEKDICLRKVSIWSLPNLKHIWNRDPEGILNFQKLQDVMVSRCHNIKNLFPFSVARGLNQLESLRIYSCDGIEHIMGSRQGSNVDNVAFEFPQLTSISFNGLHELRSIYPGKHEIKWPQLKNFECRGCDKLIRFTAETTNSEGLPFLSEQVILKLQRLEIGRKEADLLSCCINNCHLDSLKALTLNKLKNSDFLFRLLPRTPNLEKLYLWNCDLQKLLPPRRLAALEKIGTVVQLKDLSLMCVHSLRDIGFEQDPTLFQQLQKLTITYCRGLTNLALGSICFNHLTYLEVRGCHGLINLMKSSTAKSLSQLITLEVSNCKMMEEIVAEKGSGDERENEIPFHRLTTLKLDSLKNLSSFCSSKYCLFVLPLLECLVVCKCPKMKIFSQGATVKAPKLRKVYFAKGKEEGKSYWSDDLNNTIHKVSTDVTGLEYIDVLNLRDHPQLSQLEEFWHGNVPLPENCFANLKSLVVENCEFLSIGIPCHVLPYLKNLEELQVESCKSMEKIFDISNIKTGGVLFHLRTLTLRNLPNLKNIFFQHSEYLKVSNDPRQEICFSNLEKLTMERCDFLSIIIPCNLVPCLKKLRILDVQSCSSVEKIFDVNDEMMTSEKKGLDFSLEHLGLYNLPTLKIVWGLKKGFFNFPNLNYVWISSCQSLNFLFPASLAKTLQSLQYLSITNCEEMEEIVRKDEAAAEVAISKFRFPCLTRLHLEGLLKLECFYPGKHNLEFPILRHLNMFHCGKLEIFSKDFRSYEDDIGRSIDGQALFSLQEVVPKLENLTLNPNDTMMLSCGESKGILQKIKTLKLQCFHNVNEGDTLPYGFLNSIPNIEALEVFCSGFKVIFASQMPEDDDIRRLAQLTRLNLGMLPGLKSIGLEHSWIDPLCSNLQVLEVSRCNSLTTLVQSVVSFCNMKELSISSCDGLEYLFTSSTAKSLVQLEKMSIKFSKSIKQIVAKEEDESSFDEIKFGKLEELSLISLSSLLSFFTGNITLNFPSLEKLSIIECLRMEIFSQGIINAPKLEAIKVNWDWEDNDFRWDADLNTTIVKLLDEKVALQQYKYLKLSDYPNIDKVWHNEAPLPKPCFGKLQTLVVENCDFLSTVLPSYLITYLKNLKKLQVKNCIEAEVIFDINGVNMPTNYKEVSFSLEILALDELPNLKHVWSKDPEGIADFGNLKQVQVTKCSGLKTLYTTSLSKKLRKLEKLTIKSCEAMEEIVEKDEAAAESINTEFLFPWLTLLVLSEMPKLKFFYAGRHNLVCTNLKHLHVYHCGKLDVFTMESQSYLKGQARDDQGDSSIDALPLFSTLKVIPKLEELSLNEKEAMMLWHEESHQNLLHNVKCLRLYCFRNANEADTLQFGFLLKVPNTETLAIACSDFKEIFPSRKLEDDHITKLAQLKEMRLVELSELSSIGLEHSWLYRVCDNLEILKIRRCPRLTKLVQSAVSFSNLKELLLKQCHGLEYLFTSSTASSLEKLKEMHIEECESIKEIVSEKEGESTQDDLIFEQLKKISLKFLPSLTSFFTGHSSLKLPSLHKVAVNQCPKMKFFSHGSISAPILMGIWTSLDKYGSYDLHWECDLNSTIKQLFNDKEAVIS